MIETGAFLLVDKGTNPNGAAATVKYEDNVYCFEASCPQCKVGQIVTPMHSQGIRRYNN